MTLAVTTATATSATKAAKPSSKAAATPPSEAPKLPAKAFRPMYKTYPSKAYKTPPPTKAGRRAAAPKSAPATAA